jgi:chromosome partitioning protein
VRRYSLKKIAAIYGDTSIESRIVDLDKTGASPLIKKFRSGAVMTNGLETPQLPALGEKFGFVRKFSTPVSIAVFTTKGGVLKSSLSLNFARIAALHNIKTCVIGLDIQGDVTTALGFDNGLDDNENFAEVLEKINRVRGLPDFYLGSTPLNELVRPTDLPTLFFIPETPELAALNESLAHINRREYWLREKIINPLKRCFDLVIMDCSPNWNRLATNALMSCDVLLSPLECKINNFRNFKVFRKFLDEFKHEMMIDFETIFIPTRYTVNRRLCLDIKNWYQANVAGCLLEGIRESVLGEEAMALNISLLEHAPNEDVAREMRALMIEIYDRVHQRIAEKYQRETAQPVYL